MVLTLATTAAAGSSSSCLFSGSAAETTITAIPAAVPAAATTAAVTTTAQTTALAAKPKDPNKKFSYGHFGRADPLTAGRLNSVVGRIFTLQNIHKIYIKSTGIIV